MARRDQPGQIMLVDWKSREVTELLLIGKVKSSATERKWELEKQLPKKQKNSENSKILLRGINDDLNK